VKLIATIGRAALVLAAGAALAVGTGGAAHAAQAAPADFPWGPSSPAGQGEGNGHPWDGIVTPLDVPIGGGIAPLDWH
jgi:hypothetical protein